MITILPLRFAANGFYPAEKQIRSLIADNQSIFGTGKTL
jgi:hypothetical protein